MVAMEPAQLARVVGGVDPAPNRSSYRGNDGTEVRTERTDYAYCVDAVRQNCRDANPGLLWGTNERAAAQCALREQPAACPATLSGGPSAR